MDKELTWEEESEKAWAEQQDAWGNHPGDFPLIAAQTPLDPSTSRLRQQIASIRRDAACLLNAARGILTGLGRIAGDQIEALRTSMPMCRALTTSSADHHTHDVPGDRALAGRESDWGIVQCYIGISRRANGL